jgi:FtsP/CotA-like multicopper oxidase with cupredoxin domain
MTGSVCYVRVKGEEAVGSTVDLLIDASNPGAWMLHCHIAEHLGAGMMAVLHVDP